MIADIFIGGCVLNDFKDKTKIYFLNAEKVDDMWTVNFSFNLFINNIKLFKPKKNNYIYNYNPSNLLKFKVKRGSTLKFADYLGKDIERISTTKSLLQNPKEKKEMYFCTVKKIEFLDVTNDMIKIRYSFNL